jgi:cyclic pyranopterin phosphate synthase
MTPKKILMIGLSFLKNNEIDFRYIELMQTGDNIDYFNNYHVPAKKIYQLLK